jgi:hypothetical protein
LIEYLQQENQSTFVILAQFRTFHQNQPANQRNKQTNKQANKQTNKQTHKHKNKQIKK